MGKRLFPSWRRPRGSVHFVTIGGEETLPVPRKATRYPFARMKPGDRCFVPLNPIGAGDWHSQVRTIRAQLRPHRGKGKAFSVRIGKNQHGWWVLCYKGHATKAAGARQRTLKVELMKRKRLLAALEG